MMITSRKKGVKSTEKTRVAIRSMRLNGRENKSHRVLVNSPWNRGLFN